MRSAQSSFCAAWVRIRRAHFFLFVAAQVVRKSTKAGAGKPTTLWATGPRLGALTHHLGAAQRLPEAAVIFCALRSLLVQSR